MKPPARHPCEYAPSGGAPPSAWTTCFGMSGSFLAHRAAVVARVVPLAGSDLGSRAKSARRDLPDRLDTAVTHADDLIGQVAARAGVERVEAHPLTEGDDRVIYRVPHAVLLGQPLDDDAAVG